MRRQQQQLGKKMSDYLMYKIMYIADDSAQNAAIGKLKKIKSSYGYLLFLLITTIFA